MKENDNSNVELKTIDIFKVCMMLCVVLYHCTCVWQDGWSPIHFESSNEFYIFISVLGKFLNSFHVYGFVFASGYIFYYLRYEKKRYRQIQKDIIRRAKQLLVPYMVVMVIWCIPFYYFEFGLTRIELIKKFVLGISPSQLWFLLMLFEIFIIFYFLSDLMLNGNEKKFFIIFYFLSVGIRYLVSYSSVFNILQLGNTIKFMFFFFIGMCWRKQRWKFFNKRETVLCLVLSVIMNIVIYYYPNSNNVEKLFSPLVSMLGIIAFFNIGYYICIGNNDESKIFLIVKKYSMSIYLLHQQIIYFIINIVCGMKIPSLILLCIIFVVALLISILIAGVVSRSNIGKIFLGIK